MRCARGFTASTNLAIAVRQSKERRNIGRDREEEEQTVKRRKRRITNTNSGLSAIMSTCKDTLDGRKHGIIR